MKAKRGRKSEASLAIACAPQSDLQINPRPDAPYELTDEEAGVWRGIVNRLPADWFQIESFPLLTQYCRHIVQAKRLAELVEQAVADAGKDGVFSVKAYGDLLLMQKRESEIIARLATKMRLCQQSTIDKETKAKGVGFKRDWKIR